jgi:uncharacterized protein YajQ (UPF0234 family)
MADSSFDIVSKFDMQELDNAINQAMKEIGTRFDFRGSKSSISLDKTKKEILLESDSESKLESVVDILSTKLIKRGLSIKHLDRQGIEQATAGTVRQKAKLVDGIPMDKAKAIVASLKEAKLKVQASIQDEQVRITGKSRDDCQAAIAHVRSKDFGVDVQFTNYR